jgi:hypothetical protein
MKNKHSIAVASIGVAFFLLSCTLGAALTPPSTATPTPPPTETPQPSPTATLLVDLTPPTPVPTATGDPNSPDYWACRIRSQAPRDGVKVDPKERFDVGWQVENSGYGTWEPESIRVTYFSGTRMQVNDSVRLKGSLASDTWTLFVVPMVAPRSSGKYTTVWALWHGDNDFCHMKVSIVVK